MVKKVGFFSYKKRYCVGGKESKVPLQSPMKTPEYKIKNEPPYQVDLY